MSNSSTPAGDAARGTVRFVTLDPGHFHAALVHKRSYPQVSPKIHVYGPLGPDLLAHLTHISHFNNRADSPTAWEVEVHAGPDFLDRMLRDGAGNVVVLAGKNRGKIRYILESLAHGFHVLSDKPWIIEPEQFPELEEALARAERNGLIAYDIMTERYEVTNALQRELVRDPAVFGSPLPGSVEEPSVTMRSVHHLSKTVAGRPLQRPVWFFDAREQGEALADVGTHLVDLSIWTLFPDEALDYRRDVEVLGARRWPTMLARSEFRKITGQADFPPELAHRVIGDELACDCNTAVDYTLRGIHVHLDVLWDVASEHGDTHDAVYRGSKSSIEVHQGPDEAWQPELYVVPNAPELAAEVRAALEARLAELASVWPDVGIEDQGRRLRLVIPDRYRVGHEYHFGEVTDRFLEYFADPERFPAWENPNMLVKYFITTRGTELSRRG